MKISIICVGRLKEGYWRDACAEYEKRLGRYDKLEILEVADERTPDNLGTGEARQVLEREGQRILKAIRKDSLVVALAILGKQMTSEKFAAWLERQPLHGVSHVTFLIGGSLGLSEEVLQRADLLLSFSEMTFPHQMMRVILLEQIYRGRKIAAKEPYHK